jgi:hypothetical protein
VASSGSMGPSAATSLPGNALNSLWSLTKVDSLAEGLFSLLLSILPFARAYESSFNVFLLQVELVERASSRKISATSLGLKVGSERILWCFSLVSSS